MSRARTTSGPSAPAPVPGPLVAVCTGHRCAGLRRMSGEEVMDEGLRTAVRSSSGGVLLGCPCLGRCERGPVTVVGHHDGAARDPDRDGRPQGPRAGAPTPTVWLTESSAPSWREALEAWVARGATVRLEPRGDGRTWSVTGVPAALRDAVIGYSTVGPPQRLEGAPDQRSGS